MNTILADWFKDDFFKLLTKQSKDDFYEELHDERNAYIHNFLDSISIDDLRDMPKVMDNLMPHMIGDVVPLVTQPMINYLQGKD